MKMKWGIFTICLSVATSVAVAERSLKRRVQLGKIDSRVFPVPGGGSFDFGFALNSQMMVEMGRSDYFFALYNLRPEEMGFSADGISLVLPPTDRFGREVPSCILDKKQLQLSGAVTSFEMIGANSIAIGYSPQGERSWGIGGELEVEKAKLYMNLIASHSEDFVRQFPVAAAEGDHEARMRRTRFDVSWGDFRVSPSFYKRTDLSAVTREAAQKALQQIKTQIDRNQALPWETTVIKVNEPEITIQAGSFDGVRVGDRFVVENMRHEWQGRACKSRYRGMSVGEAAVIEVISVRSTEAEAIPVQRLGDGVYVGDRVRIHQLAQGS